MGLKFLACKKCRTIFKQKIANQKYCSPKCNYAALKANNKKYYHDHKKSGMEAA